MHKCAGKRPNTREKNLSLSEGKLLIPLSIGGCVRRNIDNIEDIK